MLKQLAEMGEVVFSPLFTPSNLHFENMGHSARVYALVWEPKGQGFLSGSRDFLVKRWKVGQQEPTQTFSGHVGYVTGLALSPDGQQVISASRDYTARVFDLEGGQCLHILRGHNSWVNQVLTSPERDWISLSNDLRVKVWSSQNGRLLSTINFGGDWPLCADLGLDGQVLVGLRNGLVGLVDLSGKLPTRFQFQHPGPVQAISRAQDGYWTGAQDGILRQFLWSNPEKVVQEIPGAGGAIHGLVVREELMVACSHGGGLLIKNRDHCRSTIFNQGPLYSLALHPFKDEILVGTEGGSILHLALPGGEVIQEFPAQVEEFRAASSGENGLTLAEKKAGLWWTFQGGLWQQQAGTPDLLAPQHHSPKGAIALSTGRPEVMVQAPDEDQFRALPVPAPSTALVFGARHLVVGHLDGSLSCLSSKDFSLERHLPAHEKSVQALALNGDESILASLGAEGSVRLWQVGSGDLLGLWQAHKLKAHGLLLSACGQFVLSAGEDGWLKLWQCPGGALLREWQVGLGMIYHLSFSQDGKNIVICGKTGARVLSLQGDVPALWPA